MINSKNWFLIISITIVFKCVTSVDIECDFKSVDFDILINQYTCDVQNNLMISSKNVVIQMFRGSHKFGKISDDVTGLSINDKKVQFIPENLGNKFKNLLALKFRQGRLKEISQHDLKSFIKLRYLNLDANDIETLDEDLFEFNPQLEIIWFESNRIKNIGMSVFEHLKNLDDLDLNGNVCISKRMSNSRGMAEFLSEVKNNCFDAKAELVKFKQKYKEKNLKDLKVLTNSELDKIGNIRKINVDSSKDIEIEELKVVVRNLTQLMKIKEKEAEEKLSKIKLIIKERDEKIVEFKEIIENVNIDKNKTSLELSNCQNKSKNTENQKFNFTTELAEKTYKITHLESQLIDLQVAYSKSIEKYENLSIQNQKFVEALNSNKIQLESKSINMETPSDEIDEKIKEYSKLNSQLEKRETDLKKFEMEVASTIAALTKSKERIEKVIKHKNQEIFSKDSEIKKLRTANVQCQNKNIQLQDQIKEIKSKIIGLGGIENVSLIELNKTKELLDREKLKLQFLEVKFNETLENKTFECLIHQELQTSSQLQQEFENFNDTQLNLWKKCSEQLENIKASMAMKNNRLKAILMDNKQLKYEKLTLLTKQGKLTETINNKTYEWSQEVETAISELLMEKSQLKNEINILTDSEVRLKNILSNKYGNCYNIIEKLNQDLKTSHQIEQSLKESIAEYKNIIRKNNFTIIN
ncbi:hypothetical protein ACKWTF_016610 [Chironomus riparius]